MIEKDLYKPPPSFPCMASLQWRGVGALCLQPSWGADIASPNTDIPSTHPFSFPSQYIPFALLIWLHFCLMLANLQWVPRGLGISILLAYGRLCLCQPLSRPPALFPSQTMHYCHSAVQPATQQATLQSVGRPRVQGTTSKNVRSEEQVQMQTVSH